MTKILRGTLSFNKSHLYEDKKKSCDELFKLNSNLNDKFYECKLCTNEMKIKFILCEECKDCHSHVGKGKELRKREDIRKSSLKSTTSDLLRNKLKDSTITVKTKELNFNLSNKEKLKEKEESPSKKIVKQKSILSSKKIKPKFSKQSNIISSNSFGNKIEKGNNIESLVLIDEKSIQESQGTYTLECMCSINKHRVNKAANRSMTKRTSSFMLDDLKLATISPRSPNEHKFEKKESITFSCVFKGKSTKIDDIYSSLCDFCVNICYKNKINEKEQDYALNGFTCEACKCTKSTSHKNIQLINDYISNHSNNQSFIIENILILLKSFYEITQSTIENQVDTDANKYYKVYNENDYKSCFNPKRPIISLLSYNKVIENLIKLIGSEPNIKKLITIIQNFIFNMDDIFIIPPENEILSNVYALLSLNVFDSNSFNKIIKDIISILDQHGINFFIDKTSKFKFNYEYEEVFNYLDIILLTVLINKLDIDQRHYISPAYIQFLDIIVIFITKVFIILTDMIIKDQVKSDHLNYFYISMYSILYIQSTILTYFKFLSSEIIKNSIEKEGLLSNIYSIVLNITNEIGDKIDVIFSTEIIVRTNISEFINKMLINNIMISIALFRFQHILSSDSIDYIFYSSLNFLQYLYKEKGVSINQLNCEIGNILYNKFYNNTNNQKRLYSNYCYSTNHASMMNNESVYNINCDYDLLYNRISNENSSVVIAIILEEIDVIYSEIYKGELFDLGEKLESNVIEKIKVIIDNIVSPNSSILTREIREQIVYQTKNYEKISQLFIFLFKYIKYSTCNNTISLEKLGVSEEEIQYIYNLLLKMIPGIVNIPYIFEFFICKETLSTLVISNYNINASFFIVLKALFQAIDDNAFNYDDYSIKIIYNTAFTIFNNYLILIAEVVINNGDYHLIDFYDLLNICYVIIKIGLKFNDDLVIVSTFFNNFITLFYYPYIKQSIDAFFSKLSDFRSFSTHIYRKNQGDDETPRESEQLLNTNEYLVYLKIMEIVSILNNNLSIETRNSTYSTFYYYNILRIEELDLNTIINIENFNSFLDKKSNFLNIFLDYLISLFPYKAVIDQKKLNDKFLNNSNSDIEDILIEIFYEKSDSQKFYLKRTFFTSIIEHISKLFFSFIFNSCFKQYVNEEITTKTLFLLKIIFKFLKIIFKKHHLIELDFSDLKYLGENLPIFQILDDFYSYSNDITEGNNPFELNVVDILVLLLLYFYDKKFNFEAENMETIKLANILKDDFNSIDMYMKLSNSSSLISKILYNKSQLKFSKMNIFTNRQNTVNLSTIEKELESKENVTQESNFNIILNFIYYTQVINYKRSVFFPEMLSYYKEFQNEDIFEYLSNIKQDKINTIQTLKKTNYYKNADKLITFEFISLSSFLDNVMTITLTEDNELQSENFRVYHLLVCNEILNKEEGSIDKINLDYNNTFFHKFYMDYTNIMAIFTESSNFQSKFNDYFLNYQKNFPLVILFNLISQSFAFLRLEYYSYSYNSKFETTRMNKNKILLCVTNSFTILKAILQDNKEKYFTY